MWTSLVGVLFVMSYLVVCSYGKCSIESITVDQSSTGPLPNGIPTYTVEILNECTDDGCSIGNVHLKCGSYSSTQLVDPKIFRRLSVDDCLVNDGKPLDRGQIISFVYSNTFSYPLSVSTATCL